MEVTRKAGLKEISTIKLKSKELLDQNGDLVREITNNIHLMLYKSYRQGKDISFEELTPLSIEEEVIFPCQSNSYVKGEKISEKHNEAEFKITFSPNATLYRHFHSTMLETVEVISDSNFKVILGSDSESNLEMIYLSKGDIIMIPAGMPHQFTNLSDKEMILRVKFNKV